MSAIFGIIDFTNKTVEKNENSSFYEPLLHWGKNSKVIINKDNFFIGHFLRKATPEDAMENQPFYNKQQGYYFLSDAVIYNRKDILGLLKLSQIEGKNYSDGMLLERLFSKFGAKIFNSIYGDWSCAIYFPKENRVILAKDHHGNSGIFYSYSNGCLHFSSSIQSFRLHKQKSYNLNHRYIAKFVCNFGSHSEETTMNGVYKILPAHYYIFDRERKKTYKYWNIDKFKNKYTKLTADLIEEGQSILESSTIERLRSNGKVGMTLSSGLDSTSIATFIHKSFKNSKKKLYSFTSVPYIKNQKVIHKNRYYDEQPGAELFLEGKKTIIPSFMSCKDVSVVDSIEKMTVLFGDITPRGPAGMSHFNYSFLKRAKEEGIDRILTGGGGNATLSWTMPNKYKLDMTGVLYEPSNFLRSLKHYLITNQSSKLQKERVKKIVQEKINIYSSASLSLRNNSLLIDELVVDQLRNSSESLWDHRKNFAGIGANISSYYINELGSHFDLDITSPFFDPRIVEYSLSLSPRCFNEKGGDRTVIKKIMKNNLHKNILYCDMRALQSSDIIHKVISEKKIFIEKCYDLKSDPNIQEFIDVDKMINILQNIEYNTNRNTIRVVYQVLLRGYMISFFLKNISVSN